MSALPNSNPSPSNRDIIQRFREQYLAAIADAQVSAEHTATEGWQKLYRDHKETAKNIRREMARKLKLSATTLEDFGWTEDNEKQVKDIVKEAVELRENEEGWDKQVVETICEPVHRCERIAIEFQNQAEREERDAPLIEKGLVDELRQEILKQPRPVWNADAGTVTLHDRTT